jgi:TRAP-type C4-dicarboxylate transport system permease small subunit
MKVINFLSRVASYIAMVTVMTMMFMTVTDVFMRYVFTRPLSGIPELTEYMLAVCLLGIVPCALAKRHIKVDIVLEHLPPRAASILDAVTLLIGIVLSAIMSWQSFMGGLFAIKNDVYSAMLQIPAVPFFMVVSLSFGLLALAMVVLLVQRIMEVAGK